MAEGNNEVMDINTEDSKTSISRIKEYPIIKDSFSKASEYYCWIKSKNSTLTSTLNWTENVVKDVVQKVEPLAASHLEPLDKYACSKLDIIETKYPIVNSFSEDVIKSTSEYYEANIKPRVDSVTGSVVYAAATPYRITTQTIELLSSTANNVLGKYMSSTLSKDSKEGSTEVVRQAYDATFKQAVKEIEVIRHYTMSNVQNLSNLLSSIYNKTVTNNEEWMRQYYEEFRTELDSKSSSESTEIETNSKMMHLATSLTNKMRISVRAMSTVFYNHLSPDNREKLDLVFAKTEQLYSTVNKSTYDTVRDQISMENVNWIKENASKIISSVKDTVVARYKEKTGKDACVEPCPRECQAQAGDDKA